MVPRRLPPLHAKSDFILLILFCLILPSLEAIPCYASASVGMLGICIWLWVQTREERENTSYPLAFSDLTFENMKTYQSTFSNQISRFQTWMFLCHSPDNMAGILMFL